MLLGDDSSWDYPRLVYTLDPSRLGGQVTKVVAGGYHSGAIIQSRSLLFMWGTNRVGQCGVSGNNDNLVLEPTPIDDSNLDDDIADVVCGRSHTLLLTTSGRYCIYSYTYLNTYS
jgi:alpha-tubulin suppressor-like RCC1 family protein